MEKLVPNLLMQGFFTTIRPSVWGTLLAMLIGITMGLCRVSTGLFRRIDSVMYLEITRNITLPVLIFIFYFFVSDQIPPIFGMEESVRPLSLITHEFFSFFFTPPILFPSFLSAVITALLASAALGLSRGQQIYSIILPQALRIILSLLTGQFISKIKDSAVVSVSSVQELTFRRTEPIAAASLTSEIRITVTLLCLILTLICSLSAEHIEVYMRLNEI
jgi:polar amino acid transport system permease protein